jgi:hypothetical protein
MLKFLVIALITIGLTFFLIDNAFGLSETGIYILILVGMGIIVYLFAKGRGTSEARSFMIVAGQPARAVPLNENGAKKRLV